jgi:NTP pyrophosphatase (non-canonical NTP hydrolase)
MSDKKFRGTRPPLAWFANEMERQLEENDYKRGWKNCTQRFLLKRLNQEVRELMKAIKQGKPYVVEEAADVANFAMMIADNFYDRQVKTKES